MLDLFQFEGKELRFAEGKPVANDVAIILGYADPASTVSKKVKPKYKGVAKMATPGGIQSVTVLEEGGIYQLIIGSKLELADKFQDWLFEEVLPQIRKTGSYSVNQQPEVKQLPTHEVAVQKARAISEIEQLLMNQPKLAQFLIDYTISDLMEQKALSGVQMRGVVEIAKQLGFSVNHKNRINLGKFVRSQLPDLGKQELRLVNGEFRPVYCYPDTEQVRQIVSQFFTN